MKEYSKNLVKPEARHRYWHIHKADRDFFPESGVVFKMKFHDETYELKVNHKDDIMTGKLYKYRFLEVHRIIVTKKKENQYVLKAPDTKLYPSIS
ncbi:MAG: hypothetical protein IS860_10825 [Nitrosopumilus sp.]|nr:hypothetical protein [Nitrosopumilus sp.]